MHVFVHIFTQNETFTEIFSYSKIVQIMPIVLYEKHSWGCDLWLDAKTAFYAAIKMSQLMKTCHHVARYQPNQVMQQNLWLTVFTMQRYSILKILLKVTF